MDKFGGCIANTSMDLYRFSSWRSARDATKNIEKDIEEEFKKYDGIPDVHKIAEQVRFLVPDVDPYPAAKRIVKRLQ